MDEFKNPDVQAVFTFLLGFAQQPKSLILYLLLDSVQNRSYIMLMSATTNPVLRM